MSASTEMDVEATENTVTQSSSSSSVAATLPWVEKYRPKELAELIAHEEIITILNKLIESNKLPHLLFHGPPGTGKTSTILACARKMYGENFKSMVLELNASDDRGIDVVRDQIKEFAGTKKLFSSGVKLVILDEADAMTNDAQSALRRVVEKYTTNTRFCMICNYVNKIIPALQSRCTRFRFAPLRPEQITGRLQDVVDAEQVEITEGGKTALLQLACGDLRRVLNLLQSAAMAYPRITEEAVYLTAGAAMPAVIDDTYQSLLNDDFDKAYKKILSVRVDVNQSSRITDDMCAYFAVSHRLDLSLSHHYTHSTCLNLSGEYRVRICAVRHHHRAGSTGGWHRTVPSRRGIPGRQAVHHRVPPLARCVGEVAVGGVGRGVHCRTQYDGVDIHRSRSLGVRESVHFTLFA